jgi:hypothetical protein
LLEPPPAGPGEGEVLVASRRSSTSIPARIAARRPSERVGDRPGRAYNGRSASRRAIVDGSSRTATCPLRSRSFLGSAMACVRRRSASQPPLTVSGKHERRREGKVHHRNGQSRASGARRLCNGSGLSTVGRSTHTRVALIGSRESHPSLVNSVLHDTPFLCGTHTAVRRQDHVIPRPIPGRSVQQHVQAFLDLDVDVQLPLDIPASRSEPTRIGPATTSTASATATGAGAPCGAVHFRRPAPRRATDGGE